MKRVSVIGISGSGKTHVALRLARILECPHIELDALYHQSGWRPMEDSLFRARLEETTAGDAWVIDGSYRDWVSEGVVWKRADTVVWIKLSKMATMRQLAQRSARRAVYREELWNGNREDLRKVLSLDPKRSILADVWERYARYNEQFEAYRKDPRFAHLTFVVLTNRGHVDDWLAQIECDHATLHAK